MLLCLTLLLCLDARPARADDGMFPAAPAARASIDYDGKGFLIRGKRTWIASGSMHYSRIPRELWRDRLLRIKRAGFNTVETYAFWNFHEARQGQWNFAGDHDFDAYLKLIKELDMYAIVRVGPYVCAEWDSGGFPVWLRFVPGLRVREDNPAYLAAMDRWFEKIMPIVAANQIHRGGAVILVQLENEHPQGWGREMPNAYFKHLRDKALALGLEVPWFFSGLHHGHDPAGDHSWDSKDRQNPWFTTEFWPGWYDIYGPLNANDLRTYDRGAWKILAYGGNGYNFYMLHGGTNFETWNDDEVASNYDYGAAVGQTGDLRPLYYRFKRANEFARSFADVLENSVNATDEYPNTANGPARVTARRSPTGTLLFVDNPTDKPLTAQLRDAKGASLTGPEGLTLAPGEIVPLVLNYALTSTITLEASACRILGVARQGDTTTLVVYDGATGSQEERNANPAGPEHRARLRFRANGQKPVLLRGADALALDAQDAARLILNAPFPTLGASEFTFAVGAQKIRVLAVGESLADRTWFLNAGGSAYIAGGFEYVGEAAAQNGVLHFTAEQYMRRQPIPPSDYFVCGPDDKPLKVQFAQGKSAEQPTLAPFEPQRLTAPVLEGWQMRRADAPAAPAFLTGNWKYSAQPLQMGADGATGTAADAYAWYRANISAAKSETRLLRFSDSGDWIAVWINGQRITLPERIALPRQRFTDPIPRALLVPLKAGLNSVAVFAAHYGRNKIFGHLGPIDQIAAKGLNGPVILTKTEVAPRPVTQWQWRLAPEIGASGPPARSEAAMQADAAWKALQKQDQDVFDKKRGFAWFRSQLDPVPGAHWRLHFENVDDNATVYLNGAKVGAHRGWGQPFDIRLDTVWRLNQPNLLVVLVENGDNTGGIMGAVELQRADPGDETELRGWKMRGGLDETGSGWQPVPDHAPGLNAPAFFRADFAGAAPTPGLHPVLRVTLTGLSGGFIWLNGHCLGRYPEKVPMPALYLPECWLLPGKNTLTIFDEEGNMPTQTRLAIEPAATRLVTEYIAGK